MCGSGFVVVEDWDGAVFAEGGNVAGGPGAEGDDPEVDGLEV